MRPVYRHADMRRLIDPATIAIVGVSPSETGFGSRTERCLRRFAGKVYLVNPAYERIRDRPCYPTVGALPEVPDCVIISVSKDHVENVVRDAAEAGAGGAIVYASGYAELGLPDAMAAQQRLADISTANGMRIIGPNCVGIANFLRHAVMMFFSESFLESDSPARIGLVSQTGSLGIAMAQALESGTSFSHVLTAGNSCDVDIADHVAYLAEDPGCSAIACLFEGVRNPARLIEAGAIARANNKPLVMYKIATGDAGATVARSHTGTLAGSSRIYRAAFDKMGAVVVDDLEALVETAAFFAKMPPPKAKGVAVISGSGGAAVMSADKAELHGVPLPQPSEGVAAILRSHIPDFGSARNPFDVTAQVNNNPQSLVSCVEALMTDETYGALVIPNGHAGALALDRLGMLSEISRRTGKPACMVSLSQWMDGPGNKEIEQDPNVALFRSLSRCFATLSAWHGRADAMARLAVAASRLSPPAAAVEARRLVTAAPGGTLTEREAKGVLALYGVQITSDLLATSEEEAVAHARTIGFPVVAKIESPDIAHKTDAGLVALNLLDEAEVRAAYRLVVQRAAAVTPPPRLNGVLIQPMIPPGVEVIVGATTDPQFGPVVVVGLGGVFVELLQDSVVALAPVSRNEALGMLGRLRGHRLLDGFRGSAPVERDALADVICRVSELAADLKDVLGEIDVNPLSCSGGRVIALDALIATSAAG